MFAESLETAAFSHPRSEAGRPIEFESNALIVRDGERASCVYRIDEGHVMLFKTVGTGRRQILSLLRPGEYFGWPVDGRQTSSASSLSPAAITPLPLANLTGFAFTRLRVVTEESLVDAYQRLTWLGRKTAAERVASFLLEFSLNAATNIPLRLTVVADYLGLRIETLSRILRQFRREGLILAGTIDERLHILDVDALIALSGNAQVPK